MDISELRVLICDERPLSPLTVVCNELTPLIRVPMSLVSVLMLVCMVPTVVEIELTEPVKVVIAVCRLLTPEVTEPAIEVSVVFRLPRLVCIPDTVLVRDDTWVDMELSAVMRADTPDAAVLADDPTDASAEELAIWLLTVNVPTFDMEKLGVLLLTVPVTK